LDFVIPKAPSKTELQLYEVVAQSTHRFETDDVMMLTLE
jgi:hypothetical protein